ncbi:MAG: hypothetical protein LBK69_00155 [Syntrophomonadaceae bacterium]|jgi:hypothetical protein|nr:hypothetical protein [Syntrophomonadaceae bacterium]
MTIRQEIHAFIDDIEESKLAALKPLLSILVDEAIVIETDLTEEERTLIAQGIEEYEKNPESFTPLDLID